MSLFGFYHFIILLYIWNICTPIIGIRTRKIVLSPFLLYFTIIYLFSLSSFLITNIHTTMNPSHTYIYQFCPKKGDLGLCFHTRYTSLSPLSIFWYYTLHYIFGFLEVFLLQRPAEDSLYICSHLYLYYIFCDQVTTIWSQLF